jgi:dipeptidyl aminopeptidase/acylaminoacyl peptidase
MRTLASSAATIAAAALVGFAAGCGTPSAPGALVAKAPDGMRIAVASTGARNVRVLHVSGGSIVRLREAFVPQGEAIASIAWSDDGRDVIVTTRGPAFVVDTRTWRVEHYNAQVVSR